MRALIVAAVLALTSAHAATPLGHQTFRFVDRTRVAHFKNGKSGPRVLVTYVRYPSDRTGPLPLVVFAHGYDLTPAPYGPLLDAWARAGYVVAAPVFPVESSTAPGGADESDLINEPGDLSFVITQLLKVHGLVDPTRIAVAGQSDGAEAAFALACGGRFHDRRVRAALILSGAVLPGVTPCPRGSPPVLATQGTADAINPPISAVHVYRYARRPRFLMWLVGAAHLPPYTTNRRELGLVERATIDFLGHYLGSAPLAPFLHAGDAAGARLRADP